MLQKHNMVKSAAGDARVWERLPGHGTGGTAATEEPRHARLPDRRGDHARRSERAHILGPRRRRRQPTPARTITAVAGSFEFTFSPFAARELQRVAPVPWNATVGDSWTANRSQNGVQAFYLANRFHDHLAEPPINFTAATRRAVDRADPAYPRWREHRARQPAPRQREHAHAAGRHVAGDADVPVGRRTTSAPSTAATMLRSCTTSTRTGSRTGS